MKFEDMTPEMIEEVERFETDEERARYGKR